MQATFLTEEQIWGDKALAVLKEYGVAAGPSDLAVILGAYLGGSSYKDSAGHMSGAFWSASPYVYCDVRCASSKGGENWFSPYERKIGGRPALLQSSTSTIRPSEARPNRKIGKIQVTEFGEYPQTAASDTMAKDLESLLNRRALAATGNKYTFDTEALNAYDKSFKGQDYPEYLHNGKRYIRVIGKPYDNDSQTHDGRKVNAGEIYWIETQPIEWLVDPTGIWVTREVLFGGIRFNPKGRYDGDFSKTEINQYMQKHFVPQMLQSRSATRTTERETKEKFSEATHKLSHGVQVVDEPLSVKEQIKFYVDTGKSFMLHGASGVGKTARVEAIDPDLTAVLLWNGVLPEDIVGKVRYPSGQIGLPPEFLSELESLERELNAANPQKDTRGMPTEANVEISNMRKIIESQPRESAGGVWVAPDWYNELLRKCAAEPSRQHVLFIDEVTNAKPTTQSLIFHIVLKKSISPSKGKLPANAVVVLAGNDKTDSNAAYNMPAPLFRRMSGHVRLKYDLPEWLEWASEKSRKHPGDPNRLNAHPLVAQFLASHPQAFYSNYNEEEPEEWAIDPRGWEQISDIIYDNGNVIRRELIENKIGKENAAALLAFARQPMITLGDVMSGIFDPDTIPFSPDQKLAITLGLRHANDRQVKQVREFIKQQLGHENLAIFDSLWAENNPERAIQIAQMQNFIRSERRSK